MTETTCLSALFATGAEAEEAVLTLERAGFALDMAVSVLGRLLRTATEPGRETGGTGGKPRQHRRRYCRKFTQFALFPNTRAGRIAVCGPMAGAMLDALHVGVEDAAMTALACALAAAGVPKHDIGQYESALARGHVLLLVTGTAGEADRAAELLATGREIEVAVHQGAGLPVDEDQRLHRRDRRPHAV